MTNYSTGHFAEKYAAEYLEKQGYKILDLNWKTKYCEIDIIAQRNQTIHFVEVKYRHQDHQGLGLEYITDKKQRQMRFAADMWVSNHHWTGEYVLAAVEIGGRDFTVTNFIDSI